ncbi:MAG: GNAT family N-acetyltransferase [Aristaeellaceae bacterium]
MLGIRVIDAAHQQDINIPNEPFPLCGRMLPSYTDGKWGYSVVRFPEDSAGEMCFPDENYDYAAMQGSSVFLGAYEGEKCVGLAILQDAWMRYMYLCDLKVSRDNRRRGVGAALMKKAREITLARGYRGLYTLAQDNNLTACLFYLSQGFFIGGLDTQVYKGTRQEGKSDIIFYLDC